jgi:hypothetical protein
MIISLTRRTPVMAESLRFASTYTESHNRFPDEPCANAGFFRDYFSKHTDGRGVWKPEACFEIYERHFGKFVGRDVHVLEIGVYSGGSLDMWKAYFGSNCEVYGVDIQEDCKRYEDSNTRIFIGDQGSREFWMGFKKQVPLVDIIIDDGSHRADDQIVTLEELLPHLRPGGVYLCEDIGGRYNSFATYVQGLAQSLNALSATNEGVNATPFQSMIASIHTYPFVVVLEKRQQPQQVFKTFKAGTQWERFDPSG